LSVAASFARVGIELRHQLSRGLRRARAEAKGEQAVHHDDAMGRPGGNLRIVTHPILCEVLKKKQGMIEKNVHRSVKLAADPQLTWEDYRIILE